jgi:hypothetical protein
MRFFSLTKPSLPLHVLTLAAPLVASLALAGCTGGDPDERAAQCPKPYLLPDAAAFTHYDGRGTDMSNLVLSARLVDVKGACSGVMGKAEEGAHAHVVMLLTRGPAATGSEVDVPYSVGVMRNGRVLDEHSFVQHVVFPPNVDTVQATGAEIPFLFPAGKSVSGDSYHLYFWLNLTPEDLAANRRARG